MANRVVSPTLFPTCSISRSVLPRNAVSQYFFSVGLTTSPVPLNKSIEKQNFFSISLCIYIMHWQRSRAFLPAGFFVYFPFRCYLYSHSAEKEPLTPTQIENMPSSYSCVCNPCTRMPLPRVIVAVLYFSNRISCVCVRSCTPADVNMKNSPVSSVLKSCSPLRWLSAL